MCSFSVGAWPHLFANPHTPNPGPRHSALLQPTPHAVSMLSISSSCSQSLELKDSFFSAPHNELLVQTGSSTNYSCCWLPLNSCVAKLTASYCSSKTWSLRQPPKTFKWSFSAQYSMPNTRGRVGLFYLPSFQRGKWAEDPGPPVIMPQ